jgi:hypothetical protein
MRSVNDTPEEKPILGGTGPYLPPEIGLLELGGNWEPPKPSVWSRLVSLLFRRHS